MITRERFNNGREQRPCTSCGFPYRTLIRYQLGNSGVAPRVEFFLCNNKCDVSFREMMRALPAVTGDTLRVIVETSTPPRLIVATDLSEVERRAVGCRCVLWPKTSPTCPVHGAEVQHAE